MRHCLSILFLLILSQVSAQTDFSIIPEYPETYTSTTVPARMTDALGFRYYWATEGLRMEDLEYRPAKDSRSSRETVEHIYILVTILYNVHFNRPMQGVDLTGKPFDELRSETLHMLGEIREFLIRESPDLETLKIEYPNASLPYWNVINGPMADAIYHTGQLVLMRRSSGNPMQSGVNVLMGTFQN